jgi:hypothetical protein
MSEDNPHERDVTLAKEREDDEDVSEAENPDNHRDEPPHSS